jgi:hypothetical protein
MATVVVLLVHNPPVTKSVNVTDEEPVQAVTGPVIGPGDGLTVTDFVM